MAVKFALLSKVFFILFYFIAERCLQNRNKLKKMYAFFDRF